MGPSVFFLRLLRVPLAWKIAGANALLTFALATGFYLLPSALANRQAGVGLLVAGILAAVVINVWLISIALRPIRELERTAAKVWSGATDVRVQQSLVADPDLRRVARTVDSLLEKLEGERARLKELSSKLIEARSSERAAIARDLTESVAQSATALALECAALKASNGNGEPDRAARLDAIRQTAADLVDEIRRIAREMHPRHIHELGLDPALRSLTRIAAIGSAQEVTYTSVGVRATADALPRAVADALYDVAREALQNARRHSSARHVDVSLGVDDHLVRLCVTDDGCGFSPAALDPSQGLGLKLIRERVALVDGTLEVISRPGKGTQVVVLVPLLEPALKVPELQRSPIANRT
jgi:signal transduction histidine kinase